MESMPTRRVLNYIWCPKKSRLIRLRSCLKCELNEKKHTIKVNDEERVSCKWER